MKRTTVRADEAVLDKIDEIALKQGKSKASIIREALEDYVTNHQTESTPVEEWPQNPMLGILALAQTHEGFASDVANGGDEAMLREILNEKYERTQREFMARHQKKDLIDAPAS